MEQETPWKPEVLKRLQELATERSLNPDLTARDIVDILKTEFDVDTTKDAVNNKIRRDGLDSIQPTPSVFMPLYAKYKDRIHTKQRKEQAIDLTGRKKLLHLCDLHIPYHNPEAVALALNLNASADVLIISELMDLTSQSTFDNFRGAPLEQEIEATLAMLEHMSSRFPQLILVDGNHDFRVQRKVSRLLPPELQLLVEEVSLLELLARPFSNIYVVGHWWVQIGDAIFAHANQASSVSMKTVADLDTYFMNNAPEFGLNMPFRVLVQAHTHSLGIIYRPNKKLFEGGMMCKSMAYHMQKPAKTSWTTGFVSLEMIDGTTDLNKAREYVIEVKDKSTAGLVVRRRDAQVATTGVKTIGETGEDAEARKEYGSIVYRHPAEEG